MEVKVIMHIIDNSESKTPLNMNSITIKNKIIVPKNQV
jgi:hypothetical protein